MSVSSAGHRQSSGVQPASEQDSTPRHDIVRVLVVSICLVILILDLVYRVPYFRDEDDNLGTHITRHDIFHVDGGLAAPFPAITICSKNLVRLGNLTGLDWLKYGSSGEALLLSIVNGTSSLNLDSAVLERIVNLIENIPENEDPNATNFTGVWAYRSWTNFDYLEFLGRTGHDLIESCGVRNQEAFDCMNKIGVRFLYPYGKCYTFNSCGDVGGGGDGCNHVRISGSGERESVQVTVKTESVENNAHRMQLVHGDTTPGVMVQVHSPHTSPDMQAGDVVTVNVRDDLPLRTNIVIDNVRLHRTHHHHCGSEDKVTCFRRCLRAEMERELGCVRYDLVRAAGDNRRLLPYCEDLNMKSIGEQQNPSEHFTDSPTSMVGLNKFMRRVMPRCMMDCPTPCSYYSYQYHTETRVTTVGGSQSADIGLVTVYMGTLVDGAELIEEYQRYPMIELLPDILTLLLFTTSISCLTIIVFCNWLARKLLERNSSATGNQVIPNGF